MALICPDCGNKQKFQVKTLRMHVIEMEGSRVEIADEDPPAVLEVLCDECESPLAKKPVKIGVGNCYVGLSSFPLYI